MKKLEEGQYQFALPEITQLGIDCATRLLLKYPDPCDERTAAETILDVSIALAQAKQRLEKPR